jgi:nitroreductase
LPSQDRFAALARARYGEGTELPPGLTNPVLDLLLSHRSIRAFSDRPLPEGTIPTLVAAAQSAPTSSNLQTWSVVTVQDAARRQRLHDLAGRQKFILQAPLLMLWMADLSRLDRLGAARGTDMPALETIEMFMVAALDAAFAAQNALVALESLGLGGVYIGQMRQNPEAVAKELNLPPNVVALFGLSVGWPDPNVVTEVKPRLPQSVVLHTEQYSAEGEQEGIPQYDETLQEFSQAHGMGAVDWSRRALTRAGPLSGLSGRDRMQEFLKALGFGLR